MRKSRRKRARHTSIEDPVIPEGEIPIIDNLVIYGVTLAEEEDEEYNVVKHILAASEMETRMHEAEATGEESVGGHAPTPDQDIVEELGEAAGIEFQDNQPLHTHEEVWAKRDRRRWELDRRSADDASS